jgi:hypothetical protein
VLIRSEKTELRAAEPASGETTNDVREQGDGDEFED